MTAAVVEVRARSDPMKGESGGCVEGTDGFGVTA